jgi:hypothetical protein
MCFTDSTLPTEPLLLQGCLVEASLRLLEQPARGKHNSVSRVVCKPLVSGKGTLRSTLIRLSPSQLPLFFGLAASSLLCLLTTCRACVIQESRFSPDRLLEIAGVHFPNLTKERLAQFADSCIVYTVL